MDVESHLRDIIQLSLGSTPETMLKRALYACIDISGATGGSILGEEGPHLQFLFSDIADLVGRRVPRDSIAGVTVLSDVVIYTYAPSDARHFGGIDKETRSTTRYLLSMPIPAIHQSRSQQEKSRNAGALQLLFDKNILPKLHVEERPQEISMDRFRQDRPSEHGLKHILWILPNIALGMEVMGLRQTSYQAIHELKNKMISAASWLDYLKEDLAGRHPASLQDDAVIQDMELADTSMREGAELADRQSRVKVRCLPWR